jgi:hypothetical protein
MNRLGTLSSFRETRDDALRRELVIQIELADRY